MATVTHPLASNSGHALNSSQAGQPVIAKARLQYAANHAAGDVIRLCKWPAGHVLVDAYLEIDDLDSNGSPELDLDIGMVDDQGTTDDPDCIIENTLVGGVAGGIVRMNSKAAMRIAAVDYDRHIAATVVTDAATLAAGEIGIVCVFLPAAPNGMDEKITL